jgi:hypothetical protein
MLQTDSLQETFDMDTRRVFVPDAAALRCILEAVDGVTPETQTMGAGPYSSKPVKVPARQANDSVPFLVLSTQRVIRHYRELLARYRLSEAERNIIHERIQREEHVLRGLSGTPADQGSVSQLYAAAA